jgi:creatinine amidohydrolase
MRWEELSAPAIEALDRDATIVVLPLGSVEQHGRHMAVGTDTLLAYNLALSAAARLTPRVAVLPPPWYGFSAHHMRFSGTVTLRLETLLSLVDDIAASVVAHGFRRLLIVNGHGGNNGAVDVLASTLGRKHYGKARIGGLTYFQLAREAIGKLRESPSGGMGHACEFETSMLLHLRPELVEMEKAAICYPDPGSTYLTTDLLGGGAVRAYHDFADLSESGTLGDPSLASAEKGIRFYEAVLAELVRFIEDFSGWRIPPPPKT